MLVIIVHQSTVIPSVFGLDAKVFSFIPRFHVVSLISVYDFAMNEKNCEGLQAFLRVIVPNCLSLIHVQLYTFMLKSCIYSVIQNQQHGRLSNTWCTPTAEATLNCGSNCHTNICANSVYVWPEPECVWLMFHVSQFSLYLMGLCRRQNYYLIYYNISSL